MNLAKHYTLYKILTPILTAIILLTFYGKVLKTPNTIFVSKEHDGIKNYASVAYHVKFDKSYLHYEGQNYPYGEHIIYPDLQPALANSLKWISNHIYDLSPYTIGIMNLTMFLLIIPTSLILFLILTK